MMWVVLTVVNLCSFIGLLVYVGGKNLDKEYKEFYGGIFAMWLLVSLCFSFPVLVGGASFTSEQNAFIKEYRMVQDIVIQGRNTGDTAGLNKIIVDTNTKLIEYQEDNKSIWWDWFTLDELDDLTLLK